MYLFRHVYSRSIPRRSSKTRAQNCVSVSSAADSTPANCGDARFSTSKISLYALFTRFTASHLSSSQTWQASLEKKSHREILLIQARGGGERDGNWRIYRARSMKITFPTPCFDLDERNSFQNLNSILLEQMYSNPSL